MHPSFRERAIATPSKKLVDALVLRYQHGDRRAGELVIRCHLPLIDWYANHWGNKLRVDYHEAMSIALLGVTEAMRCYVPNKPGRKSGKTAKFSTYLGLWVRAVFFHHYHDNHRAVSLPRGTVQQVSPRVLTQIRLDLRLGLISREDAVDKMIESSHSKTSRGVISREIAEALLYIVTAVDKPLQDFEPEQATVMATDGRRGSREIASRMEATTTLIAREQWHEQVEREVTAAMVMLSEKERFILRARFFPQDGGDPKTLQTIAEFIGVSRERIRQIETQVLKKLKRVLQHLWPPPGEDTVANKAHLPHEPG